jgi:hypothetical protein
MLPNFLLVNVLLLLPQFQEKLLKEQKQYDVPFWCVQKLLRDGFGMRYIIGNYLALVIMIAVLMEI